MEPNVTLCTSHTCTTGLTLLTSELISCLYLLIHFDYQLILFRIMLNLQSRNVLTWIYSHLWLNVMTYHGVSCSKLTGSTLTVQSYYSSWSLVVGFVSWVAGLNPIICRFQLFLLTYLGKQVCIWKWMLWNSDLGSLWGVLSHDDCRASHSKYNQGGPIRHLIGFNYGSRIVLWIYYHALLTNVGHV